MQYLLDNWASLVYVVFAIGALVLLYAAWFTVQIVYFCLKALLLTIVFQRWQYKKAKINGRTIDWKLFPSTTWKTWVRFVGEPTRDIQQRHGNSKFYGWKYTVAKDSEFAATGPLDLPEFEDMEDDEDEDEQESTK